MTIPAALTPQTICKAKAITPTPPHYIPYEENDYSPPRVEADPVIPVPQPMHKYPTRHKECLKKLYNYVNPDLVAARTQKTSEEMIDRQYLNILANSIMNDET